MYFLGGATMDNGLIELLKIYYDEFKFRQETVWKRRIQFFVIIFFISTFPTASKVISPDKDYLPDINYILFPVIGIILTLFFAWYSLAEAVRIKSVDSIIKKIIDDHYFCYSKNHPDNELKSLFCDNDQQKAHPIFVVRMTTVITIIFALIELCVSILMLWIILNDKL